jgi:DNA-binding transcriptional LysR family regulator
VLQHAREILLAADRLSVPGGPGSAARTMLRLGVSRSLLWHLRDRRFTAPAGPLGAVDFVVRSGWSPRLYRRFARGEFEAAVLLMPRGWRPDVPCQSDVVRTEALAIVVPRPPRAPAAARATAATLAGFGWVLNPDGCGFRQALSRCLAEAGHRPHVQFELDAAPQEHLAMVAAGVGASIVPASALALAPALAGQVQQLTVPRFAHELRVWAVWSARSRPPSAVAEALSAIFAATPDRGGPAGAVRRGANAPPPVQPAALAVRRGA